MKRAVSFTIAREDITDDQMSKLLAHSRSDAFLKYAGTSRIWADVDMPGGHPDTWSVIPGLDHIVRITNPTGDFDMESYMRDIGINMNFVTVGEIEK